MSIRFGVSGLNLLEPAGGFASALTEMCGVALRPWVATDYDHLLEAVSSGSVGVAWMPPLLHARASSVGVVLAALCERKHSLTYRSALVVRDASNFYGVSGPALAGARVAWVDPRSTGGYLFPRMHLAAAGVDPKVHLAGEEFYGSHPRAIMAVVRSEADLCACHVSEGARDAQLALAEVRRIVGVPDAPLRVLAITESIPADGIVLGPAVAEKDALLRGLLRLHERIEGAQALRALTNADRLVAPTAEVQHIIARLRVHPAAARLS